MPMISTMDAGSEAGKFRKQMGQISRQSTVFFAGTMFSAVATYVFKVYLARALGAQALGLYALGMTIVGFFGIFNCLGLAQSAVRFVPMYAATKRFGQLRAFLGGGTKILLFTNVLLCGVLVLAGRWIALRFYHAPALSEYLYLFAGLMLLGAFTTFFGQVLTGLKDVTLRTVITNFVGNPLMILLTVLLLLLGAGLRGYIYAQIASALATVILMLIAIWKLTPGETRASREPLPSLDPEVVSFSAIVFGIGALEFILAQSDKILIGIYRNPRELGIYSVASAIVAFVPIALQSVNQIFSPTIADLHARGEGELLKRLFQSLTKWILAFTIPLATVVVAFSVPLMRVFGQAFEAGWPILVIGAVGQLVNCGVGSVGYLLLMSGNQKRLFKVQAVMALTMISLNLALIPLWGIAGAALAAATVNIGTNAWSLREVRSSLGFLPYNRSYLRLLPSVLLTLLSVLVLKLNLDATLAGWANILVTLALAYAVFFGVAVAFGLDSDDQLIARVVWSKVSAGWRRVEVAMS